MEKIAPIFSIINDFIDWLFSIARWIQAHNAFVIAIATAFIAAFTVMLWFTNRKLWKVSYKAAKAAEKSANAAKKTADALQSAERAHVFVKVKLTASKKDALEIINYGNNQGGKMIVIELIATNYGKTPAILMNINHIADIFDDIEIDDLLLKGASDPTIAIVPGAELIGSGINEARSFPVLFLMDDKKRELISNHAYKIVCFGRIQYKDVFDVSHDTVFCWEFNKLIDDFYPGNKDHKRNYRT